MGIHEKNSKKPDRPGKKRINIITAYYQQFAIVTILFPGNKEPAAGYDRRDQQMKYRMSSMRQIEVGKKKQIESDNHEISTDTAETKRKQSHNTDNLVSDLDVFV